ncbi:formate dehydrogenase accessory sulfurtransferase FdhD [Catellatospora tritici]|uniref:formate dehydrogenase accessory sulfurtransferase FdhD n=1 Tax=Catellatospora tritici TaxID=2851566 RepID=UPI001C2D11C9|nr:formate dehydrogenase accessory sulfurtransferase FdhD [Catellatospora tritici]MBV1849432.1 formate dehydrogenase accessory sulfurtransferase FdhD [Catellatospora tritici]MBV1854004.1 formate dehydrogenase accessory sulfurtransferase FdhD [Catellatospora tritici]
MGRASDRRTVTRIDLSGSSARRQDMLAAEEPLEIRVGHRGRPRRPLAVTMRTPGDELDLALGFLLTEGVITSPSDVITAQLCAGPEVRKGPLLSLSVGEGPVLNLAEQETEQSGGYNVVDVVLADHVPEPQAGVERNFYTTSSCGVCGKASIDAIRVRSRHDVTADPLLLAASVLAELPDRLRKAQRTFERTGGLHAAGLFTTAGELVSVREDVGRHNAVDKVIGAALQAGRLPLAGHVLLVSGRASFELTQKAWLAGIPVLAAVSAPSTLAVDLAEEAGMTLVGFLRGQTMNVYTRPDRILP